jgi:hypothetical protein
MSGPPAWHRPTWRYLAVLPLIVAACSASVAPSPPASTPSAMAAASLLPSTSPVSVVASASNPAAGIGSPAAASAGASVAPAQSVAPTRTPAPTVRVTVGPTPTRAPTPKPAPPATPKPTSPPSAPCYVFPSSNVWNKPVNGRAVASNSAAMIQAIGLDAYLHADFDAVGDGIPYNIVTSSTPTYNVSFEYADESDPGPYPIPSSPRIEGGSDRHLLAIDTSRCMLWELYAASKSGSSWSAGSGAVFDLRSNALRPAGWTSADAAGLPIFPGLVRYEEVATGSIDHALRFTAPRTCGYIYPATHLTAPACSNLPPMGLRVRLKASVDISGFGPNAQVVLTTLKKYGMILADNGSPWFVSGTPDKRWNDDEFHALQNLHGSDFEVVDTSGLRNG